MNPSNFLEQQHLSWPQCVVWVPSDRGYLWQQVRTGGQSGPTSVQQLPSHSIVCEKRAAKLATWVEAEI